MGDVDHLPANTQTTVPSTTDELDRALLADLAPAPDDDAARRRNAAAAASALRAAAEGTSR